MNASRARQPWYQAYCVAMLQTDQSRLLSDVDHARKAIECRVAELSFDSGSHVERRELHEALRYLSMLIECCQPEAVLRCGADQTLSSTLS